MDRAKTGRAKGTPNKTTTASKGAILLAAGDVGEDGKGRDGLQGYLRRVAKEDVGAFGGLLDKGCRCSLHGDDGGGVQVDHQEKFGGGSRTSRRLAPRSIIDIVSTAPMVTSSVSNFPQRVVRGDGARLRGGLDEFALRRHQTGAKGFEFCDHGGGLSRREALSNNAWHLVLSYLTGVWTSELFPFSRYHAERHAFAVELASRKPWGNAVEILPQNDGHEQSCARRE